jgi:iron complex outermembrane receptor protein
LTRRNSCQVPILVALVGSAALAQNELPLPQDDSTVRLKSLSLEDLSKLQVTSVSKEARPAFGTAAAITVFTRDDIRRSGATSIPDVLRLVPGVEVAQLDANKWAIGIRGFQGRLSKSVLVMIDGRSVYTPLFAGVYWEMQNVMLESIERIEVIRGPGGTIWGANAVNGVINIITRRAQDTRGTLVTAGGGNVEQGFLNAYHGGGNDKLSYRASGGGFTRAPGFHPDGRNFDDWRRVQGGFRLDWNPESRDSVNVIGNAYRVVAGSKLGISTYSPPALVNLEDNGSFSGQNIAAGWRRALDHGSDVQVRAYYDRTSRDDLNYREVRNTFDVDFIHHLALDRHDVIWGAGIRVSPSTYTQKVPTVDFLPHTETYNIYSAFAQASISLAPNRLVLTIGTKIEHNSYSGFEIQPSARFSWTPTEQQTVWGALTHAVRTPSRIEQGFRFTALAVPSLPLYLRLIGDGQFTPEQLNGYELGYRRYLKNAGFISVATYYNRYDDLLSVENLPAGVETSPPPTHLVLPLYLRNGIQTQTAGVEIASLWDLRRWWRVRANYAFMHLDAKRKPSSNDASTVGQLEGDSPVHTAVIQSFLTLPRAVEFSLTYRYVAALTGTDQKVPAYSTGDAQMAKHLTRDLQVSIVGRNLLQPAHPEYAGPPGGLVGVRRSAYLQLTWTQ